MREVSVLRWLLLISMGLLAVRLPLQTGSDEFSSRSSAAGPRSLSDRQELDTLKVSLAGVKLQLAAVTSTALSWESACGLRPETFRVCASRVQLWGERNSGTNALQFLMQLNFGTPPNSFFRYGHKHLFLNETSAHHPNATGVAQAAQDGVPSVILVREPLAWLDAMHRKPHHSGHMKNTSIADFLKSRWRSQGQTPGGAEYFKNILALRRTKLDLIWQALHLDGKRSATPFLFVRYEDLVEDAGIRTLCRLAKHLGLCPITPFLRPLDKQVEPGMQVANSPPPMPRTPRAFEYTQPGTTRSASPCVAARFSKESRDLVRDGLDWQVEARVGYGARSWMNRSESYVRSEATNRARIWAGLPLCARAS